MKIAVITYHCSNNKGAVMQTYGLCRFLREQGHELELIDIRQSEKAKQSFIVKILKFIIAGIRMKKDMKLYYPPLTKRYHSVDELRNDPPQADCYIVGSDQVWNPTISKDHMMAYFLDFGDNHVRRISFASSFGTDKWNICDPHIKQEVKRCLKRFDYLSVRERQGQEICENTFDVSAELVLDPTFLHYSYSELIDKETSKPEFLCYKLNRTSDYWENTPKIGKILGIKPTNLNYNYPRKGWKYCFPPSLRTWMTKFKNASFILTDSFHGVAFSIINRKQFVVILNADGKNSRLINLLNLLGLQDRAYPTVKSALEDKVWEKTINYSEKEALIKRLVDHSRMFLISSLK